MGRKDSFDMRELGEQETIEDPDAPDQLHLQESDLLEKFRIMEKFLAFWLPEMVRGNV